MSRNGHDGPWLSGWQEAHGGRVAARDPGRAHRQEAPPQMALMARTDHAAEAFTRAWNNGDQYVTV